MVLRSDSPLRGEEPEARETLLRVLRHEGVRVVTGAREIAARDVPGGTELTWIGGSATAEALLVATGREPRVDETDPAEGGHRPRRRRRTRRRAPRDDGTRHLGARRRDRRRPPPLPVHARRDLRGPAGGRERAARRAPRAGLHRDAARHVHRSRGRRRRADRGRGARGAASRSHAAPSSCASSARRARSARPRASSRS